MLYHVVETRLRLTHLMIEMIDLMIKAATLSYYRALAKDVSPLYELKAFTNKSLCHHG